MSLAGHVENLLLILFQEQRRTGHITLSNYKKMRIAELFEMFVCPALYARSCFEANGATCRAEIAVGLCEP